MRYIMVLNDGETFTDLEGCAIVAVSDDADTEAIEDQLDSDTGNDWIVTFGTDNGVPMIVTNGPQHILYDNRG